MVDSSSSSLEASDDISIHDSYSEETFLEIDDNDVPLLDDNGVPPLDDNDVPPLEITGRV